MKWLPVVLALSGCIGLEESKAFRCESPDPSACSVCPMDVTNPSYGTCGGAQYRCDPSTGEWVVDGYCEPFGLKVRNDATLAQSGTSACMTIPAELVLTFTDSSTVTATSPTEVTSITTTSSPRVVDVHLETDDVWEVPVDVVYDLVFNWDGTVTGSATADATSCSATLAITGSFEPVWAP